MMNRFAVLFGVSLACVTGAASAATTFSEWDTNNDSRITKDEYYGRINDLGLYSDWDTDDDGLIDESEFAGTDLDGRFVDYDLDGDGYVDSGEFYDTVYITYDVDENGHWDGGEWDDVGESGLFDV